jgi:tartrate-resistant acid phosphatase type 5
MRSSKLLLFLLTLFPTVAGAAVDVCGLLSPGATGRAIPPVIQPAPGRIRVLAFGDFGDGGATQKTVAAAMVRHAVNRPFDFGLTLGDNFYERGINQPTDPRWQRDWESLYTRLGIRFYATLGNHDYADPASPGAEIARTQHSRSWCLPTPYYTYLAGPVQFFALDTNPIERAEPSRGLQLRWLREQLARSTARWKVVYGHHPIYSNGLHGNSEVLIRQLLPILKRYRVDVYLAGHDHDLQALAPDGGVHFFVSGSGGHGPRELAATTQCRAWAVGKIPGFAVLEARGENLSVSFFDGTNGRQLRRVQWKKGQLAFPNCER